MDKEQRRRNWEAKRLYEERRFRKRVETIKPLKESTKRLTKQEILNYEYCEDLPSDVDPSGSR